MALVGTTPSPASPKRAAGLADEATLLYAQGRLRETVLAMAAAVAEDPNDAHLHFMYGTALFRSHEFKAARQAYERAAALRWDHPDTHLNLGFARFHSGCEAQAREAWREAVRQAPADPLAHLALALGEWTCGDHDAALLEMDLAAALGDPASLMDARTEVRWGRRGTDEIGRLLDVWRRTPACAPASSSTEAAR